MHLFEKSVLASGSETEYELLPRPSGSTYVGTTLNETSVSESRHGTFNSRSSLGLLDSYEITLIPNKRSEISNRDRKAALAAFITADLEDRDRNRTKLS